MRASWEACLRITSKCAAAEVAAVDESGRRDARIDVVKEPAARRATSSKAGPGLRTVRVFVVFMAVVLSSIAGATFQSALGD